MTSDFDTLLGRTRAGDETAFSALLPQVYRELKRLAQRQQWAADGRTPTLDTTALVHEALAKLMNANGPPKVQGHEHLFRLAATAMRQVAIDYARQRQASKRNDGLQPASLDDALVSGGHSLQASPEAILRIDRIVDQVAQVDERTAEVLELRLFGGMTETETAAAMGVSRSTIQREWAKARALAMAIESEAREQDRDD